MIIFDLDGTLADCSHRRHFVTGKKKDWNTFFEACYKDTLIEPVGALFHHLHRCDREVHIWSGRSEKVWEKTATWLRRVLDTDYCSRFCLKGNLKMRPMDDFTPDEILKERWLDEVIAKGGEVEFVFDDRLKVIRMWQRRGIFVFNCNQTNEEF